MEALKSLVEVPEDCDSLIEYLKRFELPLKLMQTKSAIARIAYELVEDAALEGVRYIEIRFAPHLHLEKGLSLETVIEAALEGAKNGEGQTGTRANLILCCMRHLTPESSLELVEAGKSFLGQGVVALDLAGDEQNFPPEAHAEAFERAKNYGYHRTVHAGETGNPENIRKSIEILYAERIGHGVCLENDPVLFKSLQHSNIALEMCPTSNLHTKAAESYFSHPLHRYLTQGIRVTLNTDNRTVSGITLREEFKNMHQAGLNIADVEKLYQNAVDSIFDSEDEKQRLRNLWPV
jgi:adenosine deaminase